jgi:hypothetical protein
MHRAVGELSLLGDWLRERISLLMAEQDPGGKEALMDGICAALIRELGNQDLSEGTSDYLPDHGPLIQKRIEDRILRERNVWVG